MTQVRVKSKFQVTLPTEIRERLGLAVGDLLEVDVQDDQIVLRPQLVIDKAEAFKQFRVALQDAHEHNKDLDDDEIIEDVINELHDMRTTGHA